MSCGTGKINTAPSNVLAQIMFLFHRFYFLSTGCMFDLPLPQKCSTRYVLRVARVETGCCVCRCLFFSCRYSYLRTRLLWLPLLVKVVCFFGIFMVFFFDDDVDDGDGNVDGDCDGDGDDDIGDHDVGDEW